MKAYLLLSETQVDNLNGEQFTRLNNRLKIRGFHAFVQRKIERLCDGIYGFMNKLWNRQPFINLSVAPFYVFSHFQRVQYPQKAIRTFSIPKLFNLSIRRKHFLNNSTLRGL